MQIQFSTQVWKENLENNKPVTKGNPTGIYLVKVKDWHIRTRCEIYSELTINTPERRHWGRSGVFSVYF